MNFRVLNPKQKIRVVVAGIKVNTTVTTFADDLASKGVGERGIGSVRVGLQRLDNLSERAVVGAAGYWNGTDAVIDLVN